MIFDTSYILDVMKNEPNAIKKLKEVENSHESKNVTTITFFELWTGLERSTNPEDQKKEIKDVLSSMQKLSLTPLAAKKAGEIDGNLISDGNRIQPEDTIIAGIAISNSEKLLTADEDFEKVSEKFNLKLEKY